MAKKKVMHQHARIRRMIANRGIEVVPGERNRTPRPKVKKKK